MDEGDVPAPDVEPLDRVTGTDGLARLFEEEIEGLVERVAV